MAQALRLARRGLNTTTPNPRVGCVIVHDGRIVGEGWHERAGEAHAEVYALRAAGPLALGATAYVTLEPCSMCSGAMIHSRLDRLVFATADPKAGAAGSVLSVLNHPQLNHKMLMDQGVLGKEAAELLRSFFRERRTSTALA